LFHADGAFADVTGAVLSIWTAGLVAVVTFPALSATDVVDVSAAPSPEIVEDGGQLPSMPDNVSEHDHAMVTSLRYQPAEFGAVVGAPVRVGATLSILTPLTVAVLLLSALSVAVPVTDWPLPLLENVVGPEQLLIPDSASEQLNDAVTSVLFQPFAFAAGEREPLIKGGILSSLTVTLPVPVFPNRSVAIDVRLAPVVFEFCELVDGVGPDPTPEALSLADQLTDTLLLFQPAAFGAGETAPVTTGPVLSRLNDADVVPDLPVQEWFGLTAGDADTVTLRTPSPAPAVNVNVHDDFAVVESL